MIKITEDELYESIDRYLNLVTTGKDKESLKILTHNGANAYIIDEKTYNELKILESIKETTLWDMISHIEKI